MIKLIRYTIFLNVYFYSTIALSQPPDYVYEGGVGGGFSSALVLSPNDYLFMGSSGDGFASSSVETSNDYLYLGSNGDGFSSMIVNSINDYFYLGSTGDGFASAIDSGQNNYLYFGSSGGGYAENEVEYSGPTFLTGGQGQGYDLESYCEPFIWTGTIGEGWNVADNWNYSVIPDINRPVIIPPGVPNFPNVNAGVLSIGRNPNGGAFVCKSIWVQSGAALFTRVNNYVENYGEILLDGNMRVRNLASNAFQNFGSGEVRISSSGLLVIKP